MAARGKGWMSTPAAKMAAIAGVGLLVSYYYRSKLQTVGSKCRRSSLDSLLALGYEPVEAARIAAEYCGDSGTGIHAQAAEQIEGA